MSVVFLFMILISLNNNDLIVIECIETKNTNSDNCIAEHGPSITSILMENIRQDTIYFSTEKTGTLKVMTYKLFHESGLESISSGDYFGPNEYGGILPPCSIKRFYVCDTVPEGGLRREYKIDYKVKAQEKSVWVGPEVR